MAFCPTVARNRCRAFTDVRTCFEPNRFPPVASTRWLALCVNPGIFLTQRAQSRRKERRATEIFLGEPGAFSAISALKFLLIIGSESFLEQIILWVDANFQLADTKLKQNAGPATSVPYGTGCRSFYRVDSIRQLEDGISKTKFKQ